MIIKPNFTFASDFHEGLASIETATKWGYIDKTGEFIIKPQFDNAADFSEGLAVVLRSHKFGFIDKTGRFVIQPQFNEAHEFSRGLARVFVGKELCYVDKVGNFVWSPSGQLGNGRTTTERKPDKIEIMTFAQLLVEKRLKSPSTAEHPSGTSNYEITDLGDNRYRVSSYVDSQNSFSAMIRTRYTVTIKKSGDSWILESITTDP